MGEQDNDNFKDLVEACYGVLNLKTSTLIWAKDSSGEFARNISFNDFINKFLIAYDIDKNSLDVEDLHVLVEQTKSDKNFFILTLETNQGKTVKYSIKYKLDGEELLFHIIAIDNIENTFQLYDSLTKVLMRESIETIVKNELNSKSPSTFSLIVIDIDNFKSINDTFGHLFGDKVLTFIAKKFKEKFINSFVGRIGGDEFVIMMRGSNQYDMLMSRIQQTLDSIESEELDFLLGDEKKDSSNVSNQLDITFTAGVSRYPNDGNSYEELFQKADKALYAGKKQGKRCFIIYDDELHKNIINQDQNDCGDERKETALRKFVGRVLNALNANGSESKKLEKAFKLMSEYLMIDRISMSQSVNELEFRYYFGYANPLVKEASLDYIVGLVRFSRFYRPDEDSGLIIRNTLHDLNDGSNLYDILKSENVKSFARIPLIFGGKTIGFIRFDMCSEERFFKESDESLMRLFAQLIALFMYRQNESEYMRSGIVRDSLTSLINLDTFYIFAEEELYRTDNKYSLIYADISQFKLYNDQYGYELGNKMLKAIGNIFVSEFTGAHITRITSDKFLIFQKACSKDELTKKILKCNEDIQKIPLQGSSHIVMQYGIYVADQFNNINEIIDKARTALKSIKKTNTIFKYYDKEMYEKELFQTKISNHFLDALKNNEFLVYFQPKINAKTGEILGVEALSRWNFEHQTLLEPNQYIPILESNGHILNLDLHIFKKIAAYIRNRLDKNKKTFPISINLSKISMNIRKYLVDLDEIRKFYNVPSNLIEFEIPEDSEWETRVIVELISKLKALGYKVSIDGFGKSLVMPLIFYNSQADIIKLDKSLIQGKNKNDKVILESILQLSKTIGVDVICEGVETEEQKNLLLSIGVDHIQGYYYSYPLSIEEFEKKYNL